MWLRSELCADIGHISVHQTGIYNSMSRTMWTSCAGFKKRTLGLIHEPFLRKNVFLSPTYEDFTKIVAFMNFFLSRIFS